MYFMQTGWPRESEFLELRKGDNRLAWGREDCPQICKGVKSPIQGMSLQGYPITELFLHSRKPYYYYYYYDGNNPLNFKSFESCF